MRKTTLGRVLTLSIFTSLLFVLGCEEDEINDIAKAQRCLDKIDENQHETAFNCLSYIEKHSSQQALILKCSIHFVGNGLTTQKISDAYSQLSNASNNKEAAMMSLLALDDASAVNTAAEICIQSEVPGLIYISSLAVMGTQLKTAFGGPLDPSDPNFEQNVQTAMDNCKTGTNCDPAAIGSAAVTLSDTYCVGSNEDSEVCEDIEGAVSAGGGNSSEIGKKLLELIEQDKK